MEVPVGGGYWLAPSATIWAPQFPTDETNTAGEAAARTTGAEAATHTEGSSG